MARRLKSKTLTQPVHGMDEALPFGCLGHAQAWIQQSLKIICSAGRVGVIMAALVLLGMS